MNELKLSERLNAVVSHIPTGASVADIGSDHAYLPVYACLHQITRSAIVGEITDGPFHSARDQVRKTGLEGQISVRKGDGLEVLSPGEVDVITIAGMGGKLIRDILQRGKDKLPGVSRLILQPNVGAESIRKWLLENGWELKAEQILEEDQKIYEILVAEKGVAARPYTDIRKDAGLLFGPFLLVEKSPVFIKKWKSEWKKWNQVLKQMEYATMAKADVDKRKSEISEKMKLVEEVLQWKNQ